MIWEAAEHVGVSVIFVLCCTAEETVLSFGGYSKDRWLTSTAHIKSFSNDCYTMRHVHTVCQVTAFH